MGEKSLEVQRPNIFEYHDYRAYFKDVFAYLKGKGMSMRSLATHARLASGYLPMIVSGKRKLSQKALTALEPHLELNSQEFSFLKDLIALNDASSQQEMTVLYKKLQKYEQYKDGNHNSLEAHELLTAWYYIAIMELLQLKGSQWEAKWIQSRLKKKLSLPDVKKAMKFLEDKNFVIVKDGKAEVANKDLNCVDGVFKLSMGEFHRQMMELAADSIHNTPSSKRNLVTHTMAINKDQFGELNDILAEALTKIKNLEKQNGQADDVYQVSLLSFPLSKGEDDEA